jgi:iron(III) transport system substrate-binding protein
MSRILVLLAVLFVAGCVGSSSNEVIVYVALDREFSEPILQRFERETGIRVRAKYDVESNKTVGLANELIESAGRGRADVFWNNEILHTLRLEQKDRLAVYGSPHAVEYPEQFRSQKHRWYGFAARARVLIVNTNLLPEPEQRPRSLAELADPRWQGKCGIAKPLFGTTATQAAVAFAEGSEEAAEFFRKVAANCQIEGGNKQVAKNVAAGRYAWGVTDTDDAIIEVENGQPVAIVFPDQSSESPGMLLIPNTLSILNDAPNPESARRLVDFLLSAEVEKLLCQGPSAQLPLNTANEATISRVAIPELKVRGVNFDAAAAGWEAASQKLLEIFQ